MKTNKIRICNMALALTGAEMISETEEPSKEAKACKIFYENAKNKLLSKYDWPFASKRASLARLKTCKDGINRFRLPADILVPREVENSSSGDWSVEGNDLITPLEKAVLRYTADISETGLFTPNFIDALAYCLAADMAVFLTDSPEAAQTFASMGEKKLKEAVDIASAFSAGNTGFSYRQNPEASLPGLI